MIPTDLFDFSYVSDWYWRLEELEQIALPESWKFKKPTVEVKNKDNPILERYVNMIFRKQAIDYNNSESEENAMKHFHIENEKACFHTGLYTPRYKAIYGYFERNKRQNTMRPWVLKGFCDELSPMLKYIEPLPERPIYDLANQGVSFNPEWSIRVNVDHILCDEENVARLPAKVHNAMNLPILLETAVELGRRRAVVEPGIVVAQGYMGKVQYLLPIYLTNMSKPDLALTLTVMDGYYYGNTCLTLDMAYLNARAIAKPVAPWLTNLVK